MKVEAHCAELAIKNQQKFSLIAGYRIRQAVKTCPWLDYAAVIGASDCELIHKHVLPV